MFLPEGNYRGKIKEWGFGKSKKGTPSFDVVVRLTHHEDANGQYQEMDAPASRTLRLWLSPPAMPMTAAAIRSLGYTHNDFDRLEPTHPEAHDFYDRETFVEITIGEYEGRDQENVRLLRGKRSFLKMEELVAADAIKESFRQAQLDRARKDSEDEGDREAAAEDGTGSRYSGRRRRR